METEKREENNFQLPAPPAEAHYTVYKLTDPEGKIYIGCTGKTVRQRWKNGKNYSVGTPIRTSIDEFGWENFKKEILCEKLTKEGAEKMERWFIAFYDSSDPAKGYNRFLGGLGKGTRMSEVTKQLASDAKNRLYEEHPEIKEKIRDAVNSLYENDPTYRERISLGVLASYEKDPTIKVRLSEIAKGFWQDPLYREKAVAARRKACLNPDLAMRQSRVRKSLFAKQPERRKAISRQMREYLSKPENRAFVESSTRAKPVICVETGEFYPSQHAAETITGYYNIHKACSGKVLTSGGYHWRYAE